MRVIMAEGGGGNAKDEREKRLRKKKKYRASRVPAARASTAFVNPPDRAHGAKERIDRAAKLHSRGRKGRGQPAIQEGEISPSKDAAIVERTGSAGKKKIKKKKRRRLFTRA